VLHDERHDVLELSEGVIEVRNRERHVLNSHTNCGFMALSAATCRGFAFSNVIREPIVHFA